MRRFAILKSAAFINLVSEGNEIWLEEKIFMTPFYRFLKANFPLTFSKAAILPLLSIILSLETDDFKIF